MKEHEADDARLNWVLHEWTVNGPLPPRFQERVWERIGTVKETQRGFWPVLPDWLIVLFAKPAYAAVCATLLLALGVSAGLWGANRATAHWDNQLARQYMASVNPYFNQQ